MMSLNIRAILAGLCLIVSINEFETKNYSRGIIGITVVTLLVFTVVDQRQTRPYGTFYSLTHILTGSVLIILCSCLGAINLDHGNELAVWAFALVILLVACRLIYVGGFRQPRA